MTTKTMMISGMGGCLVDSIEIIAALKDMDEDKLRDIKFACEDILNENSKVNDDKKYESNLKYINKCYKLMVTNKTKYFKVISIKALQNDRVTCLVFTDYPYIESHKPFITSNSSDYCQYIDMEHIDIQEVKLSTLDMLDEIPLETYNLMLRRYFDILVSYDWSTL